MPQTICYNFKRQRKESKEYRKWKDIPHPWVFRINV